MTDLFVGLHRGPIDHEASSVINAVSNESIDMGAAVALVAPPSTELLPRVEVGDAQGEALYGIAVGGDVDGIYGDGADSTDDTTRATNAAGQGVVVVTQGRCKAKIDGTIILGAPLTASAAGGLETALASDEVLAIALQGASAGDMAAVDVQRQGIL
jgi:hypothetical protein